MTPNYLLRIRLWLAVFIAGLALSGITTFPLQTELRWLVALLGERPIHPIAQSSGLLSWIEQVSAAVSVTNATYPFIAYGTDWLAFAHLVIALVFIGPCIDPVRNKWVIHFGLVACASVIPLALIAGQVRGVPFGWRLIDCSFGIGGSIPLLQCRRFVLKLEKLQR